MAETTQTPVEAVEEAAPKELVEATETPADEAAPAVVEDEKPTTEAAEEVNTNGENDHEATNGTENGTKNGNEEAPEAVNGGSPIAEKKSAAPPRSGGRLSKRLSNRADRTVMSNEITSDNLPKKAKKAESK